MPTHALYHYQILHLKLIEDIRIVLIDYLKYYFYLFIKVFFVKYNDPIYVKLEKLDIMIRLASPHNITQVLSELKEYATEVDVDFVRKSVRAIGRCAIKVENSAERCVSTLIDLIQTKVT